MFSCSLHARACDFAIPSFLLRNGVVYGFVAGAVDGNGGIADEYGSDCLLLTSEPEFYPEGTVLH